MFKSRIDKVPSPNWVADLVAAIEQTHGEKPTRKLMEQLWPQIVWMWQRGASVREVTRSLCACKKGEVVPSPAALAEIKTGRLKPPRGAKRGQVFGWDELRQPGQKADKPKPEKPTAPALKPPAERKPRVPKSGGKTVPPPSKPSLAETEAKLRSRAKALSGDDL